MPERLTTRTLGYKILNLDAEQLINSQPQPEVHPTDSSELPYRAASGRSILRHAGTWTGDDFHERLQSVYATRGKAKFD